MAVNVKTATTAELMKLPGISAKIATEIVKNRPYKNSVDPVNKVKGIGKENIKKTTGMFSF